MGTHCKMFRFAVLLVCLGLSSALPASKVKTFALHEPRIPAKGLVTRPDGRIVGGTEATPHAYPHQVFLTFDERWLCGGSIIGESTILTAGHCVYEASNVVVLMGAHDRTANEASQVEVESSSMYTHEEYGPTLLRNDIAIIELSSPITFTTEIQAIKLASVEPAVGDLVTLTGWGLTSDGAFATSSATLNQVQIPIADDTLCDYYTPNPDHDTVICLDTTGGHGSCSGDSGGPMNVDDAEYGYRTAGVTSFGSSGGCLVEAPVGYTSVPAFLSWIESHTGITP